jgi:pimeloyl-ACP methyl ester carboxylesterase
MIDYCSRLPSEEGAAELADEPALLLVHGFGAFGQQWRGQLGPLAAAGHQVQTPFHAVKPTAEGKDIKEMIESAC